MTSFQPNLRIFAKLDVDRLSDEFKETVGKAEGTFEAVDWDRARDLPWTEEVMGCVVGYLIVDEEGNVVTQADTLAQAEKVRASARFTFDVEVDEA